MCDHHFMQLHLTCKHLLLLLTIHGSLKTSFLFTTNKSKRSRQRQYATKPLLSTNHHTHITHHELHVIYHNSLPFHHSAPTSSATEAPLFSLVFLLDGRPRFGFACDSNEHELCKGTNSATRSKQKKTTKKRVMVGINQTM